jgi:hypothetical protein
MRRGAPADHPECSAHEPLRIPVHEHATQTSPRNYPGSCSQREPKRPKGGDVRSADLRGVVCGALAPVAIQKGLITDRIGVQRRPRRPCNRELTTRAEVVVDVVSTRGLLLPCLYAGAGYEVSHEVPLGQQENPPGRQRRNADDDGLPQIHVTGQPRSAACEWHLRP